MPGGRASSAWRSTATTARSPSRSAPALRPAAAQPSRAAARRRGRGRRWSSIARPPGARAAAAHPARRAPSSSASRTARASSPSASTTTAGRVSCSSGSPSRARPWPGSWTPSPSRSATACSTACRCRPSCTRFVGMRFEPAGITDDPEVRIANSLIDYLFRRLALEYLPYEERLELGILGTSERTAADPARGRGASGWPDGPGPRRGRRTRRPPCRGRAGRRSRRCGPRSGRTAVHAVRRRQMTRAGSCFVCAECGTTSGCS